jgi:hypothetical protein
MVFGVFAELALVGGGALFFSSSICEKGQESRFVLTGGDPFDRSDIMYVP